MQTNNLSEGKAAGYAVIMVLAMIIIVVGVFSSFNSYIYKEKQGDPVASSTQVLGGNGNSIPNYEPYRTTLTGEQVCLLTKVPANNSGPVSTECAIGIKTDANEYYALDFNLMSQGRLTIQNGTRFSANGLVTPIENLSSDHWQKYEVKGIFSVTDFVMLAQTDSPASPTPVPKESATGKCYVGGCSGQICSGQPGVASNCMYVEEYACYQTAKCERQATGMCGWMKLQS